MWPFLGFLSKEARKPDNMSVLVQEGGEGVSQQRGETNVAVFTKGKKRKGS